MAEDNPIVAKPACFTAPVFAGQDDGRAFPRHPRDLQPVSSSRGAVFATQMFKVGGGGGF